MTTTTLASGLHVVRHQRPTKPPRTKPFPSEKDQSLAAQKRVRDEWGGNAFNVHGGGAAQKTGHPDLIMCVRGRMVVSELKQPDAKTPYPTTLQYRRLREWRDAGALAGWTTSLLELDFLLEHLDDPDWENPQLTPVGIANHDRLVLPEGYVGAQEAA